MRFPTIFSRCEENGVDISSSPIPVAPAAHYFMGGVKSTVEGRTSITGLYAIGETACTGLHGSNRLASNSLLECVACAYELADYLSFGNLLPPKRIDSSIMDTINTYSKPISEADYDISSLKQNLKTIMWDKVGIIRDEEGLKKAKEEVEKLSKEFKRNKKCLNQDEYEYRNMLTAAALIIESALGRKESRGAHSRADYKNKLEVSEHSNIVKKHSRELVYAK
jgi:L-aspartate oxidase